MLRDLIDMPVLINGESRVIIRRGRNIGYLDRQNNFVHLGTFKDTVQKVEDSKKVSIKLKRIMG